MTTTTTTAQPNQFQWGPEQEARARALWAALRLRPDGQPVLIAPADLALLSVDLVFACEKLIFLRNGTLQGGELPSVLDGLKNALGGQAVTVIGDEAHIAQADKVGLGPHYRACLEAVRLVMRSNHRVTGGQTLLPAPLAAPLGDAQSFAAIVPVGLVLGLAGIVAAAVTTYYVSDRIAQVYDPAIMAQVELKARLDEIALRIATGQALPAPPAPLDTGPLIDKLAGNYKASNLWLFGAAILGAGAAAAGIYGATKKPAARSSSPPLLANPSRSVRRNPWSRKEGGWGPSAVSENIAKLRKSGRHSGPQASAIAYAMARKKYRTTHPDGPFPRHIETTAERAAAERRRKAPQKPKPRAPQPQPKPKHKRKPKPKPKPRPKPKHKSKPRAKQSRARKKSKR